MNLEAQWRRENHTLPQIPKCITSTGDSVESTTTLANGTPGLYASPNTTLPHPLLLSWSHSSESTYKVNSIVSLTWASIFLHYILLIRCRHTNFIIVVIQLYKALVLLSLFLRLRIDYFWRQYRIFLTSDFTNLSSWRLIVDFILIFKSLLNCSRYSIEIILVA